MVTVRFTSTLARHLPIKEWEVPAGTVGEVLGAVFDGFPPIRSYVLDDQGTVRHHVAVFVDGSNIQDRQHLTDPVPDGGKVHVLQALSGG